FETPKQSPVELLKDIFRRLQRRAAGTLDESRTSSNLVNYAWFYVGTGALAFIVHSISAAISRRTENNAHIFSQGLPAFVSAGNRRVRSNAFTAATLQTIAPRSESIACDRLPRRPNCIR